MFEFRNSLHIFWIPDNTRGGLMRVEKYRRSRNPDYFGLAKHINN
jgi:hypothetical protein